MNKIEVLQNCKIESNVIKLPDVQFDRKIYLEVKKTLELIGGKWKGEKVAGFVFAIDPTDLLNQVANGEKRNLKKEFQFFATPTNLAEKLVYYADLKNYDTILEPSAGQGAIIEHINKQCTVIPDCFEIMGVNKSILNKTDLKFNLVGDDFLKSDDKEYSKIIGNPPFSKNQDITHVYKMFSKLNRGGRIVTIMSKHWQNSTNKKETEFRNWLDALEVELVEIDAGKFKERGTSIAPVIVIINKSL
jgi:hypothetical protein